MRSKGVSRKRQTPTSPCGVTVVAISAMVASSARWTRAPSSRAAPMISAYRSAASTVVKSSTRVGSSPLRWPSASRTAWGPSARNLRSLPRTLRRASRLAAVTRVERGEISSGVPMVGVQLLWVRSGRGDAPDPQAAGACGSG